MPKRLFGLDIGSESIKAVEVASLKNELKLLAADSVPSPSHGLTSESTLDQKLIVEAIKKLVETAKIDTKLVNVSLPESKVFTRVIEMPILSDNELSSAIKWESEQYIPLPVASVSLDWEILHRDKEKNKMDVLLVGAPVDLVTKYQKILEMAGLESVFMETEIIASSRALLEVLKPTSAIIIDIGASITNLGVFQGGILVVTYSIPTGGMALTRTIAQEFGFEIPQAEEYKKTYGLTEGVLEGKIAAAIKPVLNVILTEVKKAISFYQAKNFQDRQPRRIILSGGSAKLPELAVFFTQELGIEAEIANPWGKIKADENLFKSQLENLPLYSVATGLALRVYGN